MSRRQLLPMEQLRHGVLLASGPNMTEPSGSRKHQIVRAALPFCSRGSGWSWAIATPSTVCSTSLRADVSLLSISTDAFGRVQTPISSLSVP